MNTYICANTYVHKYIYVHIHSHIHLCIYICIHIHVLLVNRSRLCLKAPVHFRQPSQTGHRASPGMGFGAHSHDAEFPDDDWNLYQHVDLETSVALNAAVGGAPTILGAVGAQVAAVLRPHERRLERQPWLASDADEELLLVLRFTSPVHIRKILVIGGGGESEEEGDEELAAHPSRLRCFVNRHEFDFASVQEAGWLLSNLL